MPYMQRLAKTEEKLAQIRAIDPEITDWELGCIVAYCNSMGNMGYFDLIRDALSIGMQLEDIFEGTQTGESINFFIKVHIAASYFSEVTTQIFTPVISAVEEFLEEFARYFNQEDPADVARRRSREDLARKRREHRGKKNPHYRR